MVAMNKKEPEIRTSIDIARNAVVIEVNKTVLVRGLNPERWPELDVKRNVAIMADTVWPELNKSIFWLVHEVKAKKDLIHDIAMYAQHRRSCKNYTNPALCSCGLSEILERCKGDYE